MKGAHGIVVGAALAKCATGLEHPRTDRWAFTLANGTNLAVRAQLDDGWLLLAASLGDRSGTPAVWDLLAWNATLPGGVRFILEADLGARAELPLDDEADLAGRVGGACVGLLAAKATLASGAPVVQATEAGTGAIDLTALCREARWGGLEREPGRLVVDLDVPGGFNQAGVAARGDGSVVASVALTDAFAIDVEPEAAVCRQALGLLGIRIGSAVRMVRAVVDEGTAGVCLEVVLGSRPSPAALGHALAALSLACRIAAREAAVLRADEAIARAYVAQWNRETQ